MEMMGVDGIYFTQYGHHSDQGYKPSDLSADENEWWSKHFHSHHIEIRNNIAIVEINLIDDVEYIYKNNVYTKQDMEKFFWESLGE